MRLSYPKFFENIRHSTPTYQILFGGVDVSDRLILDASGSPVEFTIETILDSPVFTKWTASSVTLRLDNADDVFSIYSRSNFFTTLSTPRDRSGWRTPVRILVGFIGENAPADFRVIFIGEIEHIEKRPGLRQVDVVLLDRSVLLRRAIVEEFGRPVSSRLLGDVPFANYSDVNPLVTLPVSWSPISRGSVEGEIVDIHNLANKETVNFHEVTPPEGHLAVYTEAGVDLNKGLLQFGGPPPDGADTIVDVQCKTAYRYRTPEGLLYDLAKANGVYVGMPTSQIQFAQSLLESPLLEGTENHFSGHGRPTLLQPDLLLGPVVRWMDTDSNGNFYFCANQTVFQYERRDPNSFDGYSRLGTCPDSDQALLQFVRDGTTFYLLSSGTWGGHLSSKIYKFESDSGIWTVLADNQNGQPETGQRYDYTTSDDYISDNRRNFVKNGDYLYFVFGNNTTGAERTGVKRIDLTYGPIQIVYSQGITSDFGWNFVIHGNKLYAFVCRRVGYNTTLLVYEMDLDGGNRTTIFEEVFDNQAAPYPTLASDIVVHEDYFFFVLNYSLRTVGQGPSDLCTIPVAGGDDSRVQLKRYPDMFFGPRSLTVFDDKVYFLQGQSYGTLGNHLDDLSYPTFEDSGRLGSVQADSSVVTDHGPVWRSYRDPFGTGLGMHTSCPSNLLYDGDADVLHFICGYGLFIDVPAGVDEDFGSVASVRSDEILDFNNWVWIQYGTKLATKIAVLETNGKVVWGLMEEIARTLNWELGFDVFTDKVVDYIAAVQDSEGLDISAAFDIPRSYLFFRSRAGTGDVSFLDDSFIVDTQEQTETNFIFNHIMMRYGTGIFPAKDIDLIEIEGSRAFVLDVNLLSNHDAAWATIVANQYLDMLKTPQTKLIVTTKFAPHFAVGDLIFVESEWGGLKREFKIIQLQHSIGRWQTVIGARPTEIEGKLFVLVYERTLSIFGTVGVGEINYDDNVMALFFKVEADSDLHNLVQDFSVGDIYTLIQGDSFVSLSVTSVIEGGLDALDIRVDGDIVMFNNVEGFVDNEAVRLIVEGV